MGVVMVVAQKSHQVIKQRKPHHQVLKQKKVVAGIIVRPVEMLVAQIVVAY